MRKIYCIILALVVVIGSCLFASPVYAGATDGVVNQVQFAVFSDNNGDIGAQIESDNTSVTIEAGQKVFVAIQGSWTSLSKDSNFVVKWRPWGGEWAATEEIGTGSGTAWEYWDSNYANYGDVTAHFSGSVISKVVETNVYTDPGDLLDLNEFWYPVEVPTGTGRYELVLWDAKYDQRAETITQQVDITVEKNTPTVSALAASDIGDNAATLNGNITEMGSADVVERGFDWGYTNDYGNSWAETGTFGTGSFDHAISGLYSGTTYHFRAKARNSFGWAYGADNEFSTTGLPPPMPYLQVVQGAPEKGSATWWEWIVVNPTDNPVTVTEVRVVDDSGFDWGWTADNDQGYPTSGWTDGGTAGYYWSGSETVSARSAKVFRSRPKQESRKDSADCTMTWTVTLTDYPPAYQETTVVGIDRGSWGGMFYNKPDDTTEQTEDGTYPNGLYAYLDEDISGQPLCPGTEYIFYVNVHEWAGKAIDPGGTLTITVPKEFTLVELEDYGDFSDAVRSGGGTADWTISGTNDAAISDSVDHLSFKATTPTGYAVDTNWEFDTRFTGTGAKDETVRYICEANVKITTIISITVSDGVVAYGTLTPGATQDTVTLGATQTATNNGNVAEKFHIKSSNAVGGTNWTLGSSQGDNTFTHKASIDGGSSWTPMTEAGTYYELAASVPADGSQTFDLQIGMPTSVTDYGEHTITVTILATAA